MVRAPDVVAYGSHGLRRAPSSLREADIAPLGATAPIGVFAAAAKTIPRDATFAVIGGGNDVLAALRLWLTPRILANYQDANWVILYGASVPADLRFRAKVRLAPAVYALEVAG